MKNRREKIVSEYRLSYACNWIYLSVSFKSNFKMCPTLIWNSIRAAQCRAQLFSCCIWTESRRHLRSSRPHMRLHRRPRASKICYKDWRGDDRTTSSHHPWTWSERLLYLSEVTPGTRIFWWRASQSRIFKLAHTSGFHRGEYPADTTELFGIILCRLLENAQLPRCACTSRASQQFRNELL